MTLTPYSNRVSGLLESLIGTEDPDDLMLDIIGKLSDTVTPIPDLGNYYTFVYKAKTPNITYDTNPLNCCYRIHIHGVQRIQLSLGKNEKIRFQSSRRSTILCKSR